MAKYRIDIKGVMVPNSYKMFYGWFGMDCTCPKDVTSVLARAVPGDEIEVYINSNGGVIDVGSEIYTALREAAQKFDVKIYITGQACSAASVAACAAYCEMSPTALMMVHCVSSGVQNGNHNDMEHMAEVLRTADQAMCTAYMAKAGMSQEEALDMMEHETWLTAEQAKERGLVDKIMFVQEEEPQPFVAGIAFRLPTQEQMDRVQALIRGQEEDAAITAAAGSGCALDAQIDASRIKTGFLSAFAGGSVGNAGTSAEALKARLKLLNLAKRKILMKEEKQK